MPQSHDPTTLDHLPRPERARPADVLAAIAALPPGAWIAADADNTLWSGDVGDEVVRVAAAGAPWTAHSVNLRRYFELMESAYEAGCRLAAQVLSEVPFDEARPRLEPALAATIRPRAWLVDALIAAMDRGVRFAVVSASPAPAIALVANVHGLGAAHVLAVTVDRHAPGGFVEPVTVGWGKVHAWQAQGWPQPDIALGDSKWDLPLLAHAKQGFWLIPACDEGPDPL